MTTITSRFIAVCQFVKHRNGGVGRSAPYTTVLNQPAQRLRVVRLRRATLKQKSYWTAVPTAIAMCLSIGTAPSTRADEDRGLHQTEDLLLSAQHCHADKHKRPSFI